MNVIIEDMNKDSFIMIPYFLRDKLDLKGSELIISALIYGFSQDGETWFTGSTSYMCYWTGTEKKNVLRCLKSLVDRNIIIKKEVPVNNVAKACYYKFNIDLITGLQKDTRTGLQKDTRTGLQKDTRTGLQKDTVYNIYNIDNIDNIEEREKDFSHQPAPDENLNKETSYIPQEEKEKKYSGGARENPAGGDESQKPGNAIFNGSGERKTQEQGIFHISTEGPSEAKKTASTDVIDINSPYGRFVEWQKKNTPTVLRMKRPITEDEYVRIRKEYSYEQLTGILLDMENYAPLVKKYTSANLTFRKWAKREYGNK